MDFFQHKTAEVAKDAKIGKNTKIWNYVQIRERAQIGENCILSKNVYIDCGVIIGSNVKVQNNTSVYHGVTIEDGVFVGPHVCFTNDKNPRAINEDGTLKNGGDWKVSKTLVQKGASIGANSTILPDLTIGQYSMIGSGSVVTRSVPAFALVLGNPAKIYGKVNKKGEVVEKNLQ